MRLASLGGAVAKQKKDRSPSTTQSTELYPAAIQQTLEVCEEAEREPTIRAEIDAACMANLGFGFEELNRRVRDRASRIDKARTDLNFRAQEIARCKTDTIYFVNHWGWTQDPRIIPAPPNIPFILFPHQEEYLRWRRDRRSNRENGLIRKSRDMGLTWLNVADSLTAWLFESGYKGGFGSRTEDLVDRKGDMDSIFEKIRFMLKCLPSWMVPDHQDAYMRLINNTNGASITGEGGKNIGRGGRKSVYDVDEAEFLEQDKKVDSALSETARVIFWTSTVNIFNPNNIVRKKRMKGTIPIFDFHWTKDPRKNKEWYEQRCNTLDALIVASEIDMNENAAAPNSVIPPDWVRAAMDRWQDRSRNGYDTLGVDVARGGADHTVIAGRRVFWCDRLLKYKGQDTPDGDVVAGYVLAAMPDKHVSVNIDVVGVGASPYDSLRRAGIPHIRGISGGMAAIDEDGVPYTDRTGQLGFADMRSWLYWNLRQLLDPKYGDYLELPDDPELFTDLTAPTWKPVPLRRGQDNLRGCIKVESKDDIKTRIARSTDFGDAVVYAFANLRSDGETSADWLLKLIPDASVF